MTAGKKNIRPWLYVLATFVLMLLATQLVVYQRYSIIKDKQKQELTNELAETKDKFKTLLSHNISSATTLAIMYRQDSTLANFDSIAATLIRFNGFVDIIQFSDKYKLTRIYPLAGNEKILGGDILKYPLRRIEASIAVQQNEVLFAGPYELIQGGGKAIVGRVPVFKGADFKGFAMAVSKLSTIKRFLQKFNNKNDKFVFQLSKVNPLTKKTEYFFEGYKPQEQHIETVYMPEGNWTLYVAYHVNYTPASDILLVSVLGILLSLAVCAFVYYRTRQPLKLERIIEQKTHELGERVKELSTIFQLNEILKDDTQTVESVFTRIVNILPYGWQYPKLCEAGITFDGTTYGTAGYKQSQSEDQQLAAFKLLDGRAGTVQVIYTKQQPKEYEGAFLKEERDLINTVAETIEVYFNKKINQDALAQSEANFRGAFEHAAIGMAIVSLKGEWMSVNPALCEMTGYPEEELRKLTFQQITHPDDVSKDIAFIHRAVAGEIDYYRVEKRYLRKNNSVMWINLNVALIRDVDDRPMYFVSQVENIHARKISEEALINSEANLRSVFENTEIAYMLMDKGFNIIALNHYMVEGYKEQTGIVLREGFNFLEHVVPDKMENIKALYHNVIQNKTPHQYETSYTNDGVTNFFMVNIVPIVVEDDVVGLCMASYDITIRKNMELERQKIINDLVQRNSDLEQFAHILSHNVRAPLATILGLSGFAKDENNAAEREVIVEGIQNSAQQLDEVVKDLNEILHIKRDISELKTPIRLAEIVENVKLLLCGLIKEKNAVVDYDTNGIEEIISIRPYIHSIFFNLISNAIKYSQQDVQPHLYIVASRTDKKIAIEFKDNGLGIDMDKYGKQLFGLYKRFHPEVEGRGLGLFMVNTQVKALKGEINVVSEPGQGSIFTILFDDQS